MGAQPFRCVADGESPKEAFKEAVKEAEYMHGAGGYTGTIAEKSSWILIEPDPEMDPHEQAEEMIQNDHPDIQSKWGAAGCLKLEENKYLFFGWASC